jgi:hypothetical protein
VWKARWRTLEVAAKKLVTHFATHQVLLDSILLYLCTQRNYGLGFERNRARSKLAGWGERDKNWLLVCNVEKIIIQRGKPR